MLTIGYILVALPLAWAADPCNSAQLIDEPLRSTGYVVKNPGYDNLICDRELPFGWYKFSHGNQLSESCVAQYHCGTNLPIWMNSGHPTAVNTIVDRPVCARSLVNTADCCEWKETIRVVNCGAFYAYELKPPLGCDYAYCAGTGKPCAPDMTSPTGFEPGCVPAFPKMLQSPHLSNPIVTPNSFHFNCDINFDPTRRDVSFEVQWLFGGHRDPHVPITIVNSATRQASLDQMQLNGHLGKDLSCKVRTFFTATPNKRSDYTPSNNYWVGIKMSTTRLVVGENDKEQEVKLISTIPIWCPQASQSSCKLEIYLDPKGNSNDISQTKSCTQVLYPRDWDPKTNQAVTTFKVLAQRDFKKDGDREVYLHFNPLFTGDAPPIFNNYQIPYLQIITKDKPTSTCSCTGDPHCLSMDSTLAKMRSAYLDYYKVGEFVMYRSTNPAHNFEVQVRTWACGKVACNCAVAAKEGNDVIILDMCHTHYGTSYPRIYIPHQQSLSHGMVVNRDSSGDHWIISFPSGAQVLVTNSHGAALNVLITPPEDDFGKTEGLCGVMDGDRSNDLTFKDGHHETIPNSRYRADNFVESWRIPIGDSFFDKKENIPIDPKLNHDQYYCKCDLKAAHVDCRIDANKDPIAVTARCAGCTINAVQGGHLNIAAILGRGKRSATTLVPDYIPPDYRFEHGYDFVPKLKADFPSVNGKSRADAEKACKDAFDNNPTLQQCITDVDLDFSGQIDICVEDYKYFDNGMFIESAVFAARMVCSDHVLMNTSFYDADGNPPAFITTDLCPSDCSGHGTCVHGTCHCSTGFTGDGCEINTLQGATLDHVESMSHRENSILCDVKGRYCETIFVAGNNIYNNSKLSCKVEELKFNGSSFVGTGKTFTTGAVYRTKYDTGCRLPTKSSIGGQTVVGFNISVTNDAVKYSNPVTVVRMDSICMYCRYNGETCTIKSNTCLIGGNCVAEGETKPGNNDQICDPTVNTMAWTSKTETPTSGHGNSNHVTTPASAPVGGVRFSRPDIWTFSSTGCLCEENHSLHTCACCDDGGCLCPSPDQNMCTICGSTSGCGTPLPAPDYGVDGYTLALKDCPCEFNTTLNNCACCQNGGVQCGISHRNQCVEPAHIHHCGSKPWIFGPAYP